MQMLQEDSKANFQRMCEIGFLFCSCLDWCTKIYLLFKLKTDLSAPKILEFYSPITACNKETPPTPPRKECFLFHNQKVYFHLNFHRLHVFHILIAQRVRIYVGLAWRNGFYIRILFTLKTIIKIFSIYKIEILQLFGGIGIWYIWRIFTLE